VGAAHADVCPGHVDANTAVLARVTEAFINVVFTLGARPDWQAGTHGAWTEATW